MKAIVLFIDLQIFVPFLLFSFSILFFIFFFLDDPTRHLKYDEITIDKQKNKKKARHKNGNDNDNNN